MSKWKLEPVSGSSRFVVADNAEDTATENLSAVLVVGKSQVTRIVVSKIVERCGLRPVAESPETAGRMLSALKPGTVILDGGADNCDCNHLFASLSAQRQISGRKVPRVILLSIRTGGTENLPHGSVVDAVVAKPITPETLQPVVSRLGEAVRA